MSLCMWIRKRCLFPQAERTSPGLVSGMKAEEWRKEAPKTKQNKTKQEATEVLLQWRGRDVGCVPCHWKRDLSVLPLYMIQVSLCSAQPIQLHMTATHELTQVLFRIEELEGLQTSNWRLCMLVEKIKTQQQYHLISQMVEASSVKGDHRERDLWWH